MCLWVLHLVLNMQVLTDEQVLLKKESDRTYKHEWYLSHKPVLSDERKAERKIYNAKWQLQHKDPNKTKRVVKTAEERKLSKAASDRTYAESHKEDIRKYKKKYYNDNLISIKEKKASYYLGKSDVIKEKSSRRFRNNRDMVLLSQKIYYNNNKKLISEKNRIYRSKNKLTITNRKSRAMNIRMKSDPLFKFSVNVKTLIRNSFRIVGDSKSTKTQSILGCTMPEFKLYIESQFEPWMNWSNYGNWNGVPTERNVAWDLDHKVPVSSATTKDDIVLLNHWSNFQPLCSYENRWVKSNKLQY